jgi:DNA-binding transcriptional MerR regulator
MLIGELAEREKVSTATLRRLDKKDILKAERDRNGWRVYTEKSAEELRRLYRRTPSASEAVNAK